MRSDAPARTDEWTRFGIDRASGIEHLRARFTRHAYARHAHETYAIGMTEAGSQTFACRGASHATAPGAVMLFNPAELHDGRATTASGFEYRMLYVAVPTLRRLAADAFEDASGDLAFARPLAMDPHLAGLVAACHESLSAPTPALRRDEALACLLDRMIARDLAVGARRRVPQTRADRAVARARDLLHASVGDDIGLDTLAAAAGLSRFHLTRLFRRRHGMAPSAYHRLLRLEAAKRALAVGDGLADTAAAMGFVDQSHLTRQFKAAYGLTPGRYRASVVACG